MKLAPTPLTAALAGAFSALTWPLLWPLFHDSSTGGTLGLVAGMLLFIALPAHAFVVGFQRPPAPTRGLDTALFTRIGTWLAGAAVMTVLLTLVGR